MKFKRVIASLLMLFTMLTFFGCDKDGDKISIRGEIKKVNLKDGKITAILVEGKKEENTDYDKAMVSILNSTKIYKGDTKELVKLEELKEGMKVEITFSGPVRESYPVQADAKIIRVLK